MNVSDRKLLVLNTLTLPLNDQACFIDYLIRGMSNQKRLPISISVRGQRFCLKGYSNDMSYLSATTLQQPNKTQAKATEVLIDAVPSSEPEHHSSSDLSIV